ncbi:MAG: hypothetical protein AAFR12_22180 [Cyanobacteria bacterium J06626_6]
MNTEPPNTEGSNPEASDPEASNSEPSVIDSPAIDLPAIESRGGLLRNNNMRKRWPAIAFIVALLSPVR